MGKHKTKICHVCDRVRPEFTIRKKGCDKCRTETTRKSEQRKPVKKNMADIRAKRNKLLAQSDWTQLEDVPAATKKAWKKYRRQLRNLTKVKNPDKVKWPDPPKTTNI